MKWNTTTFIKAFLEGTLKRKRVHGTYRVLNGDHCKILVRASTRYGRPDGNELIGINLSTDTEDVAFFHSYNTKCFTYHMNRILDTHNAPKLPSTVFGNDDNNLLASGIIDTDETRVLVEIGDRPYLLHRKLVNNGDDPVTWQSDEMEVGISVFETGDALPSRAASIQEATELVKDPVGMEILCKMWWVERQPNNFTPPALDQQYTDVLTQPVNPLECGFTLDECAVTEATGGGDGVKVLCPIDSVLEEPHTARAKHYIAALAKWNEALEKVASRSPVEYQGLNCKGARYSYSNTTNNKQGSIIRTPVGVYLKGKFQQSADWSVAQKLDVWYKLHTKTSRFCL
jgi:hypothetical protein